MDKFCECCGTAHDGSYGAGRFCGKACARRFSTKLNRAEINKKVSDTLTANYKNDAYNREDAAVRSLSNLDWYTVDAENSRRCSICKKVFPSHVSLRHHIKVHSGTYQPTLSKLNSRVKVEIAPRTKVELDITQKELDYYKSTHTRCEICGRDFSHYQNFYGKRKKVNLCVDHDHKTNKFRGLLCVCCNRSLEWYIRYQKEINMYLEDNEK